MLLCCSFSDSLTEDCRLLLGSPGCLHSLAPPVDSVCVLSHSVILTLCDPMGFNPPGSSVHGSLQARILGCVAIPTPGVLPNPGIETESLVSPALAGRLCTTVPPLKPPIIGYMKQKQKRDKQMLSPSPQTPRNKPEKTILFFRS